MQECLHSIAPVMLVVSLIAYLLSFSLVLHIFGGIYPPRLQRQSTAVKANFILWAILGVITSLLLILLPDGSIWETIGMLAAHCLMVCLLLIETMQQKL